MNRSKFLKSLSLFVGGVFIAPKVLAEKRDNKFVIDNPRYGKLSGIDHNDWLRKNYHWLERWLDNYEIKKLNHNRPDEQSNREYSDGMQKFDDIVIPGVNERLEWALNRKMREHKFNILQSAVFSKKINVDVARGYFHTTMSGFVEQMGRLPTKEDKVKFLVCPYDYEPKFLSVREPSGSIINGDFYRIISDCGLKII